MFEPDLLLFKSGRPIAAIEAKSRPLSRPFELAATQQLQTFSTEVGTPWAVLVDPKETRIFRDNNVLTTLSTEEVLHDYLPSPRSVVGEQTLLLALDSWLHQLHSRQDFLARHPELEEFARDLADSQSSQERSRWRRHRD